MHSAFITMSATNKKISPNIMKKNVLNDATTRSHGIDSLPRPPRRVESRITSSSPTRRRTISPPPLELDESFETSAGFLPLSSSPPAQCKTKQDKRPPSLKDERYYSFSFLGMDSIGGSGDDFPSKQGKRPPPEDKRYNYYISSLGRSSFYDSGEAPITSPAQSSKRPSFENTRDKNSVSTLGMGSLDGSDEAPSTPRQQDRRSLFKAKRNESVVSSLGMGSFGDASSQDSGSSLLENGPRDRWVPDSSCSPLPPTDRSEKAAVASPSLLSRKSHITTISIQHQTSLARNTALTPPKSYRSRIISQKHESVYQGKDPRLQILPAMPQPPPSSFKTRSSPSLVVLACGNGPQNFHPPPPSTTMMPAPPAPSFHSAIIYRRHYNCQTQVPPSPQSPSATDADPYPHIRMEHAPEKAKEEEATSNADVASPVVVTPRRVNNDYNEDGLASPRRVSKEDYFDKSIRYRSPPEEASTPKSCLPIPRLEIPSPPAVFKSMRLKLRVSQKTEVHSPASVMNVPGSSEPVSFGVLKRRSMANKFKSMVSPVRFSKQLPTEESKAILDYFFVDVSDKEDEGVSKKKAEKQAPSQETLEKGVKNVNGDVVVNNS